VVLATGLNTLQIKVIAEDVIDTGFYTLSIYRLSSDTTLQSLVVTAGLDTLNLTDTVTTTVESIAIAAIATHPNATVVDTGRQALSVGANLFMVSVIAENGIDTGVYTIAVYRKHDIAAATLAIADGSIYTGNSLSPSVTVIYDGDTLQGNTDYTLTYSNNTNAGTATATITGIGIYEGTKNETFTIAKATPDYTAPTGLSATVGQTLAEVVLPQGWAWNSPSSLVGAEGERQHTAVFTPTDADNYNTVEVALIVVVMPKLPTNVESDNAGRLQISPNPASTLLSVTYTRWQAGDRIEIYNLNGTLLQGYDLSAETTIISITHLRAGVYIVKVGDMAAKIVKP
jgi:hypothetical protein